MSPFIALGQLKIGDKIFKIQHLYGIRPFNDDRSMQTLRSDLNRRVALWIDDETPYCLFRSPNGPFCLSCGDFVLRVLYPGNQPLTPALPRDFGLAISGAGYTTDDLLLYLVGLHQLPTTDARLKQLARLDIPANLREDIKEMLTVADPLADTPAPAASAPSTVAEKAKAASKPPAKLVQRRQVRKNL